MCIEIYLSTFVTLISFSDPCLIRCRKRDRQRNRSTKKRVEYYLNMCMLHQLVFLESQNNYFKITYLYFVLQSQVGYCEVNFVQYPSVALCHTWSIVQGCLFWFSPQNLLAWASVLHPNCHIVLMPVLMGNMISLSQHTQQSSHFMSFSKTKAKM